MPKLSEVILKDNTSRSENLGTTPLQGILPSLLTKSWPIFLHISKILTNHAQLFYFQKDKTLIPSTG